ncbi:MAG: oligopeptidase B, partial [Candidatus Hodarchaeales archaeon]
MTPDKTLEPPVAKQVPYKYTIHGEEIVDNYFWLREKDNPEVIEYLKAENDYTEKMMEHTQPIQDKIFKEIKDRIKEDDVSAKELSGGYIYYKRMMKGKQYPVYIRRENSANSEEEILLDANELAEGHDYFMLGVFKVSPDHKLLIYSTDTNGSEEYTLYIKNLETGQLLSDRIEKTYYSVVWANDCKQFFYTVVDEQTKRPFKLLRHIIGTSVEEDHLVYHEPDEGFFLDIFKTRDTKYFTLSLK